MVMTRSQKRITVVDDNYDEEQEIENKEVKKVDEVDDFDLVRIDNQKLKFKDSTELKVFKYSSKDKKSFLKLDDVGLLYEELCEVFEPSKIQIRGLGNTWITLKNFGGEILTDDDVDSYFKGKINDNTRFKSFSQLMISVGN
jgi:hypothetical protein